LSDRCSFPNYRLVFLALVTILIIATRSSCVASRIDDDPQAKIAASSSISSLSGPDEASSLQNDAQVTNRAVAETNATPGPAFENSDNPNIATPDSHALLEDYRSVKPPVRLPKCIFVSGSLCAAVRDRSILALTATQTALSIADGVTTIGFVKHGYVEVDPISRILVGRRPTWSRMAPIGAIQIIASMWLAGRMKTSSHPWIRRTWWLPQLLQIGASAFGTANNLKLYR
jgi:hypothetical protein